MNVPEPRPGGPPPGERLRLATRQCVCHHHAQPFADRWPKGYDTFSTTLLQTLLGDAAFKERVAELQATKALSEAEAISDLITINRPMCCMVTAPQLMRAYKACGDKTFRFKICQVCKTPGHGGPYPYAKPVGAREPQRRRHVCNSCLVKKGKTLRRVPAPVNGVSRQERRKQARAATKKARRRNR